MSNPPPKKPRDLLHITSSPTDPLRVTLATSPQDSTLQSTTETTITLLTTLFSSTRVHKDRFIYALAGCLFTPTSPTPFGGSKTKPGYISFHGQTPAHLLHYILKNAYKVHYTIRQSKSLKLVVSSVNRVLDLHMAGRKDELDELMLKG
ncbi:hypothetical protein BCR33DRAFT_520323 [Rhizoclosmatium globosum]|uniref:Uncharacterized protein n=1 Tax=Rhizoclosmatium globosum TaxID=329046 RepID=A0A1Y2BFN6_9FUNG|nr:hypothetical protein BCR33DRAFT_520323 [Rhizoclosmatium globosum]|eukprot:ORY33624.1 hypothetical protein BCR33DRAFT_520323 [Rhizoclosmatium globosum]